MKTSNFAKLFSLIFALMITAFVGSVSAELKYYTMSGEITEISDEGGLIEDAGLNVGYPVEYVFAVDFEAQGEATLNDGSIWIRTDAEYDEDTYYGKLDFFFVDLVGKGYIDTNDPDPGLAEQKFGSQWYRDDYIDDSLDRNYVEVHTDRFQPNEVTFTDNSGDTDMSKTLSDFFALGSGFHGSEGAVNVDTSYVSSFAWEAVITNISDAPPMVDSDGDGIFDAEDSCPYSDLSSTVVVDGCDSTVTNYLLSDGCTVTDLVNECYELYTRNNRQKWCVQSIVDDLYYNLGVIDKTERQLLRRCR